MKRLAWAALLAASLGGAAIGAPRSDDREIAFLRLTDGFWQLWVMAADGSGQHQMTRSPVDKVHAAWRPGTAELLYHTNRGETSLLDVGSGEERRILDGLSVTDAAWSPDGQRLAYGLPPEDLAGGHTSLWISGLDGRDRRKLAGGGKVDALAPQWLGDAELLFRHCMMRDNMEVLHEFTRAGLDADAGPGARVEGDDEPLKFDQAVSSRGWLAYSSPRSGTYEVWTLPLLGGAPHRVTALNSYAGNPTWSPAGDALAFDSDQDGTLQVYRIRSDGRGLKKLTAGQPARKPVWRAAAERPSLPTPGPAASSTVQKPATQAKASPPGGGLGIAWVSTDRLSFDSSGETVSVRFQVTLPASVTVRFLGADGQAVRTLRQEAVKAGDQVVTWDGRDDRGNPAAPEAYVYTIEARSGSAAVTYDQRGQTGGEPVWPLDARVDPEKGEVSYDLPQASRVRLILSRQDTAWPIRALVDWEPREPGSRREAWDGWDEGHVVNGSHTPHLIPIVYAFSLPKNVVIVRGSRARVMERVNAHSRVAANDVERPASPDARLHLHARHPRGRCYDPRIALSANGSKTGDGVLALTEPTPIRFEISSEQLASKAAPIPRVSVFVFVDQVLVERFLVGYAPFNWIADPEKLGPGEHLITALLSWRDDHFGIAHVKVRVGAEHRASRNESR